MGSCIHVCFSSQPPLYFGDAKHGIFSVWDYKLCIVRTTICPRIWHICAPYLLWCFSSKQTTLINWKWHLSLIDWDKNEEVEQTITKRNLSQILYISGGETKCSGSAHVCKLLTDLFLGPTVDVQYLPWMWGLPTPSLSSTSVPVTILMHSSNEPNQWVFPNSAPVGGLAVASSTGKNIFAEMYAALSEKNTSKFNYITKFGFGFWRLYAGKSVPLKTIKNELSSIQSYTVLDI